MLNEIIRSLMQKEKCSEILFAILISILQLSLAIGITVLTGRLENIKIQELFYFCLGLTIICILLAWAKYKLEIMKEQNSFLRKVNLQERLLNNLNNISYITLEERGQGNILEMLQEDVARISCFLEVQSIDFFVGIIGCVLSIAYGVYYAPILLLFIMVAMGISVFTDRYFSGKNKDLWSIRNKKRDLLQQRILEFLQAKRLLSVQHKSKWSERMYDEAFMSFSKADITAEKSGFFLQSLGTSKSLIFDSMFIFFSLWLILNWKVQIGVFLGFSVIIQNLIWIFYYLPIIITNYGAFLASKERIHTLQAEALCKLECYTKTLPDINNNVILGCHNVTFRYPRNDRFIFKDFTFVMKRGVNEKVYLTGSSGRGKSTLLKLILGLYTVEKGNIFIANDNIGYVPQNTPLFSETLRNNILMGRIATDKELAEVIKAVNLDELISRLEYGVDSLVTQEMESNLSSGEIQKIGLARAILKTDFLILDEPFANLDLQSEKEIVKLLKDISQPVLLTSHRSSYLEPEFEEISLN